MKQTLGWKFVGSKNAWSKSKLLWDMIWCIGLLWSCSKCNLISGVIKMISPSILKIPTRAIWYLHCKTLYTYAAWFIIELCQTCCDLSELHFYLHDQDHYTFHFHTTLHHSIFTTTYMPSFLFWELSMLCHPQKSRLHTPQIFYLPLYQKHMGYAKRKKKKILLKEPDEKKREKREKEKKRERKSIVHVAK